MSDSTYSARDAAGVTRTFFSRLYSGNHHPGAVLLFDHEGSPLLVSRTNPLPVEAVLQASAASAGKFTLEDVEADLDINSMPAAAAVNSSITVKHDAVNLHQGLTALVVKHAPIAESSSGDRTIVEAVSGKRIQVVAYDLVCAAAVTVKWKSGTSTDLSGPKAFDANGGVERGFNPVGHLRTATEEDLVLNLSGSVSVGGELTYVEIT